MEPVPGRTVCRGQEILDSLQDLLNPFHGGANKT